MTAVISNADHNEQRREPLGDLGMWVFIATEVLFFGALFAGFLVYRITYAESFSAASHQLDFVLGTINTGVLLTSSFTMALAVLAARLERIHLALFALGATAGLGTVFLVIKATEYVKEFNHQLMPWQSGANFALGAGTPAHTELFFNFYFAMTGLHALHLLIAVLVVISVAILVQKRGTARSVSVVEVTGLYWHFVDMVWVFLYPLLYLVGR